jgi:ketosteroid isomerase-like protein
MKRIWWILPATAAILWVGPAPADDSPRTPTETAAAYLAAMEASDLEAAEDLFAADSLIFETGSVEGSWSQYREHHIGPELDAIESFVMTHARPTERKSADGTMAFVAWPIEYMIKLNDGRVIQSRGTVTFVLENHGHHFMIRHLHWSSRKRPAPEGG